MRASVVLLVPALAAAGLALAAARPAIAEGTRKGPRVAGPVRSASEAKAIAERELGGVAVGARRTSLNGATCGWEVDVHMPTEERGWRCIIDCDTRMIYTKDRIPNPPRGKKK